MTLREKMLAVIREVNGEVVEREELIELIAVALLSPQRWSTFVCMPVNLCPARSM